MPLRLLLSQIIGNLYFSLLSKERLLSLVQVYRLLRRTSRSPSLRLVHRTGLHKPPAEFLSQPFQLRTSSALQGVLPDNGRRGYRMRSAICLLVCELALSSSFPEVQPRAAALYIISGVHLTSMCVGQSRWLRLPIRSFIASLCPVQNLFKVEPQHA